MARYAEYTDILAVIDAKLLARLTDDTGGGVPNIEVCEAALDRATEKINGKIGMRYPLPLSQPYPGLLKGLCVDLAVYDLYGRRSNAPGEVWQDKYNRAESDLNKIATGQMTLGFADPQGEAKRQPVFFVSRPAVFAGRRTL